MYDIEYSVDVEKDLKKIKKYYRNLIYNAVDEQLPYEPTKQTKNRKILLNLIPPWEAIPPVWELKVEDYRVFYDVDEDNKKVYVRAVRLKPPGKLTEEIL